MSCVCRVPVRAWRCDLTQSGSVAVRGRSCQFFLGVTKKPRQRVRFEVALTPARRRTMPTSHPNTLDVSDVAHQHDAGDAFAALPVHILTTHVLSSRNLPDPSDLARLRAVSREKRDAVAVTGREVYELKA